jgi:hypothetical protein
VVPTTQQLQVEDERRFIFHLLLQLRLLF